MDKIKFVPRSDVVIEGNQAKWAISALGEINGTYAGDFVFKCMLTPTEQISANREYREMLGANPTLASEHESFLAYALTQLKYRVISSPPFWTASLQNTGIAGDILDEDIISLVLESAVHAQLKYKHELQSKKIQLLERAKAAAEAIINGQKDDDEDEEYFEDDEES